MGRQRSGRPPLARPAARTRLCASPRPAAPAGRARRGWQDHGAWRQHGIARHASASGPHGPACPRPRLRRAGLPARGPAGGARYPDRPAGRAAGLRHPPPGRDAEVRRPEALVGAAGDGAGAAVAAPARHRGGNRERRGYRAGAGAGLSRPHRPAASGQRRAVPAEQRARRVLPEDGAAGGRGLPRRRRPGRRQARSPHLPGGAADPGRDRGRLRRHDRDGRIPSPGTAGRKPCWLAASAGWASWS